MKRDAEWGGKSARKQALYGISDENPNGVGNRSKQRNDSHGDSNKLVKMLKDLNLLVCEWSELKYGIDTDNLKRELMEFYSCVIFVLNKEDFKLNLRKCIHSFSSS